MREKSSKSRCDAAKMGVSLNDNKNLADWKVPGNLKIRDQTVNIYLAHRGAGGP